MMANKQPKMVARCMVHHADISRQTKWIQETRYTTAFLLSALESVLDTILFIKTNGHVIAPCRTHAGRIREDHKKAFQTDEYRINTLDVSPG